ncbi:SPOR domain-containing protein [bacterium]|nr:SPOR domain-containing protein [bacterium]
MSVSHLSAHRPARPAVSPRRALLPVLFGISLMVSFGLGYRMGAQGVSSPVRPSTQTMLGSPDSARNESRSGEAMPPRSISDRPGSRPVWAGADGSGPSYRLFFTSFKKLADAEKEKFRLETQGLAGVEVIERPMPSESSVWYRLSYGRFPNRQEAVEAGRRLIARGLIQDFWPTEIQ